MDSLLLALTPADHPLFGFVCGTLTWSLLPFVVLAAWRSPRRGVVLLTAVLSGLLGVLLQFTLMRARPEVAELFWAAPSTPSFPSGHAVIAAAVAALETLRTRRWGFAAWALAIAASRLGLAHHFLSDVVVGLTIGAATGLLAYGAFYADVTRRPRWSWWLWPQLSVVVFATFAAYLRLLKFDWLASSGVDKVMHFGLYGVLAFLLSAFIPRHKVQVLGALFVLATIEEWTQSLSPARTFDLGDLACTLSGIVLLGAAGVWRTRAYGGAVSASSRVTRHAARREDRLDLSGEAPGEPVVATR